MKYVYQIIVEAPRTVNIMVAECSVAESKKTGVEELERHAECLISLSEPLRVPPEPARRPR